jgi:hypothetical protein
VSDITGEDLKPHVRYASGFHPFDAHIIRFWEVFDSLTSQDRSLLLKFVTSCERPPSLGFGVLNPPFTIQVRYVILCNTTINTRHLLESGV